jgi:hypothetical protein
MLVWRQWSQSVGRQVETPTKMGTAPPHTPERRCWYATKALSTALGFLIGGFFGDYTLENDAMVA